MKKNRPIIGFLFIVFLLSSLSSRFMAENKNQALLLEDLSSEIQRLRTQWRVPGIWRH